MPSSVWSRSRRVGLRGKIVAATAGLNFGPRDIIPNAITVTLPTTGEINLHYGAGVTGATMDLVIDVVGYTTNTGLLDLVDRVTTLETSRVQEPQGDKGDQGDAGPLTSSCAATPRWVLPACQTATITVGTNPDGVAFGGTNIWVANQGSDSVSKIVPF